MSSRSAQAMMVVGSLGRLSYALGLLLAPHAMTRRRLAAATRGNPIATMTTRAFGAVHINVSLLSLRAAIGSRDTRLAGALNLGCDLGDLLATVLEWREGELTAGPAMASVALQSASVATWTMVLRAEC
jgi:hypothetical protein